MTDRDKSLIETRRRNPCATLEQLGAKYDISRERVRQILSRYGEQTKHYEQTYDCIQCGKPFIKKGSRFCSKECSFNYHHLKLTCSWCGKEFYRRVCEFLSYKSRSKGMSHGTNYYCSKKCQGLWLAHNYGFKKGERKWNRNLRDSDFYYPNSMTFAVTWNAQSIAKGVPEKKFADYSMK